jgi:hypothetical protein
MTTVFSVLQAELEARLAVGLRERPPTLFGRVTEAFGAGRAKYRD